MTGDDGATGRGDVGGGVTGVVGGPVMGDDDAGDSCWGRRDGGLRGRRGGGCWGSRAGEHCRGRHNGGRWGTPSELDGVYGKNGGMQQHQISVGDDQ